MAQKGLVGDQAGRPVDDDDWKKQTDAVFPFFHSAIAVDDMVAKKDPAAAVEEYRKELMMYPPEDTTKGAALGDTLQLALAYVKLQLVDAQAAREAADKAKAAPGDAALAAAAKAAKDKAGQDYIMACWFFARAWNFAPANYKSQIEPQLEYYYKKYHGDLTGLDGLKTQASATLFPPGTLNIAPAKTPEEQIHDLLATTSDLNTLALADKETVLSRRQQGRRRQALGAPSGQANAGPGHRDRSQSQPDQGCCDSGREGRQDSRFHRQHEGADRRQGRSARLVLNSSC